MKKVWKGFWGVLILALLVVGSLFGYRQYQSSKILGIYKLKATKAVKKEGMKDLVYFRLKKNHKVEFIYLAPKDSDIEIPAAACSGNWHYSNNKKDKIIMSVNFPFSKEAKNTDTFKIKKNGTLVESSDSQLIKTDDFSEEKFERDYQKYKKQTNKLIKQMKQQDEKNNSSSDAATDSNQSDDNSDSSNDDPSADPDAIGRAIYARVFPSETVDTVEQDSDRYYVSNEYHSADSTIPFQINGDTVTYWTQTDSDITADGKNDAHTVSISELLDN